MHKVVLCLTLAAASIGSAATIYTYDAAGSVGTNTASAEAVFSIVPGQLTLTLSDTTSNPTDVGQNVSDFAFTLAALGINVNGGTLSSSSGQLRTVASNGTFTDGAFVPSGWAFTTASSGNGSQYYLNDLGDGAAGPAHTIIGKPDSGNVYSNANASITNTTGPHNPFLIGPVSFTFDIPGLTTNTTVSLAQFSFGTTSGVTLNGSCTDCSITTPPQSITAPEPFSFGLTGLGLIGIYYAGNAIRRRSPRQS